ncbi:hypothetical protein M407DRAFT_33895 [Tulasnella calospora MUT 4182]|uniref:Uncharacterized protein n=1 Tax=Tulasnella calospora MUT 4182 TaxID=1051891 RepID=A0A0C3Q279_9AGAM|nr:hypothetical protein M407DRAFT_33895 [Tulasnella calospora MUT 4182]
MAVVEGPLEDKMENISRIYREMKLCLQQVWRSNCLEECKTEAKLMACHLADLRSVILAFLSSQNPYPDYGQLRLLAREVKANPNLKQMYILLNTTEDLLTTDKEDSFALAESLKALSIQLQDQNPLPRNEDRQAWFEPGYQLKRMIQYRLQDRSWLLPAFKCRLDGFTDLDMERLIEDVYLL